MKYYSLMIIRLNSDKCLSLDKHLFGEPFRRPFQNTKPCLPIDIQLPGVNAGPRIRAASYGEIVVTIRRSGEWQLTAGSRLPAHRQGTSVEIGTAPTVDGLIGSITDRAGRVEVTGVVSERDGIGTSTAGTTGVECRSDIASCGHCQRAWACSRAGAAPSSKH